MLDDAPFADGTRVTCEPLCSSLRKHVERLDKWRGNLRFEHASMQIGEESRLPPARRRHNVGVPHSYHDLESRVGHLIRLVSVELPDDGAPNSEIVSEILRTAGTGMPTGY